MCIQNLGLKIQTRDVGRGLYSMRSGATEEGAGCCANQRANIGNHLVGGGAAQSGFSISSSSFLSGERKGKSFTK